MKVLITTTKYPKYKGDNVTSPFMFLLSKFLNQYFDVYVLAPYSKNSKKEEIINGIKVHRFKYWFNTKKLLADRPILPNLKKNKSLWIQVPFLFLFEFISIVKIVKRYNIELIHANWVIPQGLLASMYKKFFNKKIKTVITSHGGDMHGLKRFGLLKKWALNNSDAVAPVSNAIKEEIEKLGINKNKNIPIRVIPMGVDTSLFAPDKKDEFLRKKYGVNGRLLLFVGRLSEEKGVQYLIRAMPYILQESKDTKLLIVGDGEERDELEKLAKKLGLYNDKIIFTGSIPNNKLPKYYASADIFIGPSITAKDGDREGLPVSFCEAMSSGCITVVTNIPGITDLIKDGKTGFIVKQRDSQDIAEKVIYILKNYDSLKVIKTEARKYITNNFDWKIISKRYKEFFETVCQN